jgi:hypothetical protein
MKSSNNTKSKKIRLFVKAMALIFFIIIALPTMSFAFGTWNQETTARELCFLFTLSKDWQQTLDISKNPDEYSEQNAFLGRHPDQTKVNMYFAGCAMAHAFITYILPPKLSKVWQVTWIGIQSSVTDHNINNGLEQSMDMEYMLSFSIPF